MRTKIAAFAKSAKVKVVAALWTVFFVFLVASYIEDVFKFIGTGRVAPWMTPVAVIVGIVLFIAALLGALAVGAMLFDYVTSHVTHSMVIAIGAVIGAYSWGVSGFIVGAFAANGILHWDSFRRSHVVPVCPNCQSPLG